MTKRYDSIEYLREWKESGQYPRIHDQIFHVARAFLSVGSSNVVDLCASTGLLGRRVINELNIPCLAIEANSQSIQNGYEYGAYDHDYQAIEFNITDDALELLEQTLRRNVTTDILARRCFYELAETVDLSELSTCFKRAGVRQIIMEGHKYRAGNNPLVRADEQAFQFLNYYDEIVATHDVRVLQLGRRTNDN